MTARSLTWYHYGINARGKNRNAAIADAWAQIADLGQEDAVVIVIEHIPQVVNEVTDTQWYAEARIAVGIDESQSSKENDTNG